MRQIRARRSYRACSATPVDAALLDLLLAVALSASPKSDFRALKDRRPFFRRCR
jgi:hypothetical protein